MSGPRYQWRMPDHVIPINDPAFASRVGQVIAEARRMIGWSQAGLAERAHTSQANVSRIESGRVREADVAMIAGLLAALGIRGHLALDAPHLADRARQREPVHARMAAVVARRVERAGWSAATEVPIGDPVPYGWIDVLAYRASDRAGLIVETKGDLPDIGGLQRQVTFYTRTAHLAAEALGWQPERFGILVAALDTQTIAARLSENAAPLRRAFPGTATAMQAWIETGGTMPDPTLAMIDPRSRESRWLRAAPGLTGRRSAPRYANYAEAAAALSRRRPPGAPPRSPPPSCRSRPP